MKEKLKVSLFSAPTDTRTHLNGLQVGPRDIGRLLCTFPPDPHGSELFPFVLTFIPSIHLFSFPITNFSKSQLFYCEGKVAFCKSHQFHPEPQKTDFPIPFTCMFLDCWRQLENLERIHAHTGRTCELHTERSQTFYEAAAGTTLRPCHTSKLTFFFPRAKTPRK